ncbi:MAG TPA: polysaccharide biosynthesis tyrosine autokinase [Methylomirabilota bacterium]|nr:polysaccharide biosynthesis tyrosine autokinase [Methylomirabilota bacterium]
MDPLKIAPQPETKLHFLDYWRIIRIRKTVILAVFLLVVITATLVTFILPESYSSKARIKIERDQSDIAELQNRGGGAGAGSVYDPYFIQTEFEVIQSELILGKVIEALDLNKAWGAKFAGGETLKSSETIALLKNRMDLRPVRNTQLIEIVVFSEKPEEAMVIANKIAEAYRDYRVEERKKLSMGGINALKEQFEDQEKKVRSIQEEVDRLRKDLKVSDVGFNTEAPAALLSAETLRRVEALRIEGRAQYQSEKALLERLQSLGPEELPHVIPTAAPDNLLSSYLEQLTMAEQKLIQVKKDYGPEHIEVLKAANLVEDLHDKVKKRVDGILAGLGTRVYALAAKLDKLEEDVTAAQSNDIAKAEQSQPYFEKKRQLDEFQRFRQILYLKIASEKIDTDLPKTSMVQIVDRAVQGLRPVRPNKPLNIVLGIIIGLVVGVGLAFFIEYLDTSVKTIDDVERSLQAPVLGVIPQNVGLLVEEGAESPHAEAYRVLRTNLLFSRKDDKLNTVAVVSAGAGEGKSTTVFNLAAVFAQSGQRVLVVDSDLRRPTLHKMFHVTNSLGLTNYLLKQNTLEEVIQTSKVAGFDFLASGKLPSSSLGILSSAQMKSLIGELKQRYDFVFFDSPPIMGVSDASILASEVDMTLQVIQYRRYPQPMNIRAKQLIEKVGGNLVGIVLNNINMSQDESYYYYSGYYHEYYSRNEDQEPVPPSEGGTPEKPRLDIKPKY